jgi:heme exporter protein B
MLSLIRRDLAQAWRAGGAVLPVVFFLLVATLFAFAVGPDAQLLARTGGGVLWMAALLAALLPVDRLIEPDRLSGVLDQLAVRGMSDESVAAAKLIAHWLSFGPPLRCCGSTRRRSSASKPASRSAPQPSPPWA